MSIRSFRPRGPGANLGKSQNYQKCSFSRFLLILGIILNYSQTKLDKVSENVKNVQKSVSKICGLRSKSMLSSGF